MERRERVGGRRRGGGHSELNSERDKTVPSPLPPVCSVSRDSTHAFICSSPYLEFISTFRSVLMQASSSALLYMYSYFFFTLLLLKFALQRFSCRAAGPERKMVPIKLLVLGAQNTGKTGTETIPQVERRGKDVVHVVALMRLYLVTWSSFRGGHQIKEVKFWVEMLLLNMDTGLTPSPDVCSHTVT